jgi:hypothetical protein
MSGSTVLNAAGTPSGGTFAYSATPTGGGSPVDVTGGTTTLPVGTYNLTATYTPPDTVHYNDAMQTVNLTVSGESVWITDGAGGTSELAGTGYGITSTPYTGGENAVAIDHAGNVWSVTTSSSTMIETTQVGTKPTTTSAGTGGLNGPTGIALDGASQVWTANSTNNSVSQFSNGGTAISPSGGYTSVSSPLQAPGGIAVDLSGSVWVTSTTGNSVTRFLGVAAPVAPLATAAANNTTGAEP